MVKAVLTPMPSGALLEPSADDRSTYEVWSQAPRIPPYELSEIAFIRFRSFHARYPFPGTFYYFGTESAYVDI
jgi:hypothetical protein